MTMRLKAPRATAERAPAAARRPLPAWLVGCLKEPLLHFVVLGALLFAVDQVVVGRADDPRRIVVTSAVDTEARTLFRNARGREPDAAERKALRQVWLDNEVLYREGLAQQVDKGDTAIRERVIFKSLSLVDASLQRPVPTADLLRAWFEKNRAKYDEPARYDFQEAALNDDATESAVRAFVRELNAGTPGEARAGLRVFKSRPHATVVQSYGDDFAKALEEGPVGPWRALATRDGWRAVRLDAVTQARPAQFEALAGVVQQDWIDATMADLRTAQVRQLARQYHIVDEVGN